MQYMFHGGNGNFKMMLEYAKRCRDIAETSDNLAIKALAHANLGRALQFAGDLGSSRTELESLMRIISQSQHGSIFLGYNPHYRSGVALARTLWLQGYPSQAVHHAREAVNASEAMGHSAALALALSGAGLIFLWIGDLDCAQDYADRSYALAESNAMGPVMAIGRCRKAEITIRRGNIRQGVDDLRAGLEPIHASRHEVVTTEFDMELALGLLSLGHAEDGLNLVNGAIDRVNRSGELFQMPELLRVKGKLLCAIPGTIRDEAEACFRQSFDLARSQGARAWELRTATDFAAFMTHTEHRESAKRLLQEAYSRFTEGFETTDLTMAADLLSNLA
jgi:predicted ATPase